MNNNERSGWLVIGISILGVFIAGGFVAVRQGKHNRSFIRHECINRLTQIDEAKRKWSSENKATNGSVMSKDQLAEYIKISRDFACPQGRPYNLGRIGEPPTCSVPGHSL